MHHPSRISQSFHTPRKLLLQLRALAFEKMVVRSAWKNLAGFVVWGAGRDGKDFVKAISAEVRERIVCFVNVDPKKINHGFNENQQLKLRIPILHFS